MTVGTVAPFSPLIIGIFLVIALAPPLMKFSTKNRKRMFHTIFVILIFVSLGVFFNPEYKKTALLSITQKVLMITTGVVIVIFIAKWIFLWLKKDKVWWNESLITVNNTEQTWISSLYSPRVGIVVSVILVVITLGILGYNRLGQEVAKTQEEFLVFPSPPSMNIQSPEVAVLRVYGEYVYAVPFHRDTKKFEKKLFFMKMSDMKAPLSYEKVGPLQPEEIKPAP
jgi:hypothetical protein